MDKMLRELRLAFRWLRKNPSWSGVAVLVLAATIGLAATTFSLLGGTLFEPLPYGNQEELYQVLVEPPPGGGSSATPADGYTLEAWRAVWREDESAPAGPAAYRTERVLLPTAEPPVREDAARVQGDLFDLLRVPAALGRALGPADEGRAVVVLSHGLWRRGYGADDEILGKTLSVDGEPHEVVGVMPADFFFPDERTLLWRPLSVDTSVDPSGQALSFQYYPAVVRGPVGNPGPVESAANTIYRRLIENGVLAVDPESAGRIRLEPLGRCLVADVRPGVMAVSSGAALLLLIACANLALLLLAKNTTRMQELAVRSALGATRPQIVRQLLTEAAALVLLGGASGFLVALALQRLVPRWLPTDLSHLGDFSIDWKGFGLALAITALTVLLATLSPFVRVSRVRGPSVFRGPGGGRRARGRGREAVVVCQVALATVLMIASGLLVHSFLLLSGVETGFEPGGVVSLPLEPSAATGVPGPPHVFYGDLLEELTARPDIAAAGVVSHPPMGKGLSLVSAEVEDGDPQVRTLVVPQGFSEGYLEAVGLQLLSGRNVTPEEHRSGLPVALVNETFGRAYLSTGKFLGRRVWIQGRIYTVVGLLNDLRLTSLQQAPKAEIYLPFRSLDQLPGSMTLVARAAGGRTASSISPSLRDVIRRHAPTMPLQDLIPLGERVTASTARPRFYATSLATLSTLALLLAAVGIYGVLSYAVGRQARSLGIRQSLGATRNDIFRWVAGRGGGLVAVGVLIGLAVSWSLAVGLESLVYEVTVRDVRTYLVAVALVTLAAGIGIWFPARRAMRLDPSEALRSP